MILNNYLAGSGPPFNIVHQLLTFDIAAIINHYIPSNFMEVILP